MHSGSLDHLGEFWPKRRMYPCLVVFEQLDRLMSRLYTPRTFAQTSAVLGTLRFLIETRTFPLCALFLAQMKMQNSLL